MIFPWSSKSFLYVVFDACVLCLKNGHTKFKVSIIIYFIVSFIYIREIGQSCQEKIWILILFTIDGNIPKTWKGFIYFYLYIKSTISYFIMYYAANIFKLLLVEIFWFFIGSELPLIGYFKAGSIWRPERIEVWKFSDFIPWFLILS